MRLQLLDVETFIGYFIIVLHKNSFFVFANKLICNHLLKNFFVQRDMFNEALFHWINSFIIDWLNLVKFIALNWFFYLTVITKKLVF